MPQRWQALSWRALCTAFDPRPGPAVGTGLGARARLQAVVSVCMAPAQEGEQPGPFVAPEVGGEPAAPGRPESLGELVPEQLVELVLSEVRVPVLLRPGQEAGLVVLAEVQEPFRALHIYVGQPEAKAIQAGWHGGRAARPGTWDLLLQLAELLGARLDRVVIDRVEEARHFFATLLFERAGELLRLPCRPSDAVALAVRAPTITGIYATEEVMAAAGQYP